GRCHDQLPSARRSQSRLKTKRLKRRLRGTLRNLRFGISMPDVTQILNAIDAGDPHAAEQLLPLVYDELRKLAAAKLAHERPGQPLDARGLVHEAYVRLVGSERRGSSPPEERRDKPGGSPEFANTKHFFAAAAEAMRRILIERARQRS